MRLRLALIAVLSMVGSSRAQVNETWSQTFSPTIYGTGILDLVLDGAGGIVLGGYTELSNESLPSTGAAARGLLARYDANGTQLWNSTVQPQPRTLFKAMARTPSNEFVACGLTSPTSTSLPISIIVSRFGAAGAVAWSTVWSSASGSALADDIAVDGNDNAFVCGRAGGNMLLIKLDTAGNVAWASPWNGSQSLSDSGAAVVPDGAGGAYATGAAGYGFATCMATVHFDTSGAVTWWREFLGTTTPVHGRGFAITTDVAGNVYVAGSVGNPSAAVLVAYDGTGQFLWSRTATPTAGQYNDVEVDVHGEIVVVGRETNDAVLRRFDALGSPLVTVSIDGPAHGIDQFSRMSLDEGGDAYAIGTLNSGSVSFDALSRIDRLGNIRWTRTAGGYACVAYGGGGTVYAAAGGLIAKRLDLLALPFCYGDGSSAACPCGNASGVGDRSGCLNALSTAGALIDKGHPSLSADSLILAGNGMPNGGALYFQGSNASGLPFGDGLLCVTGAIVRLGVAFNVNNGSTHPSPTDPPISVAGHISTPGIANYQVWYRDSASFCTVDTYNLTNGLAVIWVP